jgi:hypothetical protein
MVERIEVETPFDFQGLVAAFETQLGHHSNLSEDVIIAGSVTDEDVPSNDTFVPPL